MSRSVKQIFLILSNCAICIYYANATPQLPPLEVSDDVAVIDKTKEKPSLNAQDTAAGSINIDQFINDVDKKITEKDEGELSQSTNSNIPIDNNNHNLVVEQSITEQSNSQESRAITQVPQQQTQATLNQTVVQPGVNNVQPSDSNIQPVAPQPTSLESSPSLTTEQNNPSALLVPAYDSEQPKPAGPQIVLDNPPSQQQAIVPDSFIIDELQVALNLATDEIEVGELTRDAYLDQISFDEYHNIFWQKHYEAQRAKQRKVIESFVNDYDKKFNQ